MQETNFPGQALDRPLAPSLGRLRTSGLERRISGQVTLSRYKLYALLVMLGGYLVLNYGFLVVRIPPVAAGVPLGETLLAMYLLTTRWSRVLPLFARSVQIYPFLGWWIYGFTRLSVDATTNGMFAFRDATQVIESLYVLVGFVVAGDPRLCEIFFRGLKWIVAILAVYGLTVAVPGIDRVFAYGPTFPGSYGQSVPILGNYANTGPMLLWVAAYLLLVREGSVSPSLRIGGAAVTIVIVLVVIQARSTYTQLALVIALMMAFRRGTLVRFGVIIPVFLLAVGAIELGHIPLPGRLTSQITFDFFLNHIEAMVGASDSKVLAGAENGVTQRLEWWADIYKRVTVDTFTTLTGLGYGMPLIHFATVSGIAAREPHNSIISVAGRLGVIGLVFWTWMQVQLYAAWTKALKAARSMGLSVVTDRLIFLLTYFLIVMGMVYGEDPFEKPYFAIPYYMFWGVVLRTGLHLRVQAAQPVTLTQLA